MSAAPHDISDVRKAWKEANLAPLWENAKAHRPAPPPDAGYLWSWDKIRPLITAAIEVASPEAVERRVLQLVPPIPECQDEQQTSRTLAANIQILLPGEKARPHRHTMNALRFVLEGSGASTIVDGKPCPMEEGDLILTPAWTWHEHVHQGKRPDHLARCPRCAVPAIYGHRRVPARAGRRDAGDRRRRRVRRRQCRARHQLRHHGVFAGLPLSLCQHGGGGRGRAARARRLAPRALRQPAHRRPRHGDDGLLPGAARCRRGHAAVPHDGELGLLRGGGHRREPGRQPDHPMAQARHLHACRKAIASFTRRTAAPRACSRSPTATCMPGSGCSRKSTGISRPDDLAE